VVSFVGNLTVIAGGPVNYVDFTGNLGGISSYGRLKYGLGHYSRVDAFALIFAGDLDIAGQDFFNGDLGPVVTFAGNLSFVNELAGDLAPTVVFAGAIGLLVDLAGDLAPQIGLGGLLGFDLLLAGDLPFQVDLAAPSLISGPLWAASEPCPTPPWTPSDPCPPSMWTPSDPCDPVEWEESELCNG
jgi:hypothetical protein